MSTERLNRNFHEFLQLIYDWPTLTIEKSILILKLEELCQQNPELQHIYDDLPPPSVAHQSSNHNSDNYSRLESTEDSTNPSTVQNNSTYSSFNSSSSTTNNNHTARKRLIPTPIIPPKIILVKEGDLTVKKGSTVLSPIIKKLGLKPLVSCELSYTYCENEKLVYFVVYQSRKCRKVLHKFIIDDTCKLIFENKREFQFKHDSAVENFLTEAGIADTWISSFNEISARRDTDVEEIYENPEDLYLTSEPPSSKPISDTPIRPPPRPPSRISPENIYVCLYDHHSPINNSQELVFNRGDLLYIINTEGPSFYVGHRLTLPMTNPHQTPIGLVFKEYIRPAYEKVC